MLFDAVPAVRAAILLAENDGADFASVYVRARDADTPGQISRSLVRQVMTQKVAVVSNDAADPDAAGRDGVRPSEGFSTTATTQSILCAPLSVSEQLQGAVDLATSVFSPSLLA